MDSHYPTYEVWLRNSVLDLQDETKRNLPESLPDTPGSLGTIPAGYISRAVREHQAGEVKLNSGIRSPGLTIRDDLHLENFVIPFPLFLEACIFEGNLHIWLMRASTLSLDHSILRGGADLRGTQIDGNLLMRHGFIAHGPILARDMRISGSAEFSGSSFFYDSSQPSPFAQAANGDAFGFSRSTAASLYWRDLKERPKGVINLRDAHVRSFVHDLNLDPPLRSWPAKGLLILDGFTYDRIEQCEQKRALDWLNLQKTFTASSYSALARAFEAIQLRQHSEDVLAALKREEIRQIANPLRRNVASIIYWMIGYGQQPHRALFALLGLFCLHWISVWEAQRAHDMRPAVNDMLSEPCFYGVVPECTKNIGSWKRIDIGDGQTRYVPADYPDLTPFEYSLESFVPLLDLKQREYWEPVSGVWRILFSAGAGLGIFLGGLFVGAVSGLLTPRPRN